jgi:transcriptional regulator GlxA family with amidase domain
MQIVIPLFDRFNVLDATGPYEVLRHLPDVEIHFSAERPGLIADVSRTCSLHAEAALADLPRPDVIVVPGGGGRKDHMHTGQLRDWLIEADQTSTWTTSVCTGALILAGAGLLKDRAATTHWAAMDELPEFGARPRRERYVFDGKYITAAGVSAGIDMSLALAAAIAGEEVARDIQSTIEYDPAPPFAYQPPRLRSSSASAQCARSRNWARGRACPIARLGSPQRTRMRIRAR